MKILFVSECFPDKENPQYCIYLEQQAKEVAEKGHIVDILVPKICNEKSSVKETVYNGLKVFNVTINKGKSSKLFPLYSLRDTLEIFPIQEYDAVSIHLVSNGLSLRISNICKAKNIPLVMHFHGLNVWKDYYANNSIIYKVFWFFGDIMKRRYLKNAAAIVGVSQKVCDVVKSRFKGENVFTVYNGVDNSKFSPNKEKQNAVFTVLCVANLIKIKGHDYLLEAVAKLKENGKKIKLQLIGTGPEEERLKKKCNYLKISENVEFLGTRDYTQVSEYMRNADMFIMPSFFEALGCVYLESMCSGTLTSGCFGTGADEIIENKSDGLLVQQRSTDSIYKAILFALENPEERQKIAEKGIIKAKSFSWENSANTLIKVYEKILKEG